MGAIILLGMKHNTAAVAVAVIVAVCCRGGGGCGSATKEKQEDQQAANLLGPAATYVLSDPTRVDGWNFQRPDGSIATDPQIQQLKTSTGKDLAKVLLDGDTYKLPARGGGFERAVGYRVWRGSDNVEIYLSFANDQMYIKYPGATAGGSSLGFTNAREALLKVSQQAFPNYNAPDAPKIKKAK